MTFAVTARWGAKLSEDLAVPLDRLEEAIEGTLEVGRRHGLPACSWGHAGDGNVHSTFLLAPDDPEQLARAARAADDVLAMALQLGGTVSGEHGLGLVRSGWLARQWGERAVALHAEIKRVFDPKGLLNPGRRSPALRGERRIELRAPRGRVLVAEDERRPDLEHVLLRAGAADQDAAVAEAVDDSAGEVELGETRLQRAGRGRGPRRSRDAGGSAAFPAGALPTRPACSISRSSSITSRTASAAAAATGLPPKVLKKSVVSANAVDELLPRDTAATG